jgi:uncharacterized membrane protein HdeD (DUF308 family)
MAMTAHHGEKLRTSWVWMALFGVISLIGGVLALANPLAATLAATVLAGWVFTLLGVLQVIQAFRVTGWPGFIWSLLFGILVLAVGSSLVFNPLAGMVSLTLLVAVLFIVTGAVKAMYALSLRPISGWGWVLTSGIVSVALGVMILANFPWSAVAVLGILLAIELISNGVLFLLLAMGLRRV